MGTYSMETPPPKSGRYLVHHQGWAKVLHYLHPDGDWAPNTRTGWRGDLGFLPTHWSDLPMIANEPGTDSAKDRAERLIKVYGPREDLDLRPYYMRHPPQPQSTRRNVFLNDIGWQGWALAVVVGLLVAAAFGLK